MKITFQPKLPIFWNILACINYFGLFYLIKIFNDRFDSANYINYAVIFAGFLLLIHPSAAQFFSIVVFACLMGFFISSSLWLQVLWLTTIFLCLQTLLMYFSQETSILNVDSKQVSHFKFVPKTIRRLAPSNSSDKAYVVLQKQFASQKKVLEETRKELFEINEKLMALELEKELKKGDFEDVEQLWLNNYLELSSENEALKQELDFLKGREKII